MEKDLLNWGQKELSNEEKIYGNKILLEFMGFEHNKSEKWLLECSRYDHSHEELLKVAFKISEFDYPPESDYHSVNKEIYWYNQLRLSEIKDISDFFRRTVNIVRSLLEIQKKSL